MTSTAVGSLRLVLGADSSLGEQVARQLSAEGHLLLFAGRDELRLQALAWELGGWVLLTDPTSMAETDACLEYISERFGCLTGVVACVKLRSEAGSVLSSCERLAGGAPVVLLPA